MKLPNADRIERINPSGQAPIAHQDTRTGTPYNDKADIAKGLSDVAGVIGRKEDAQAKYQTSKADSEFLVFKHGLDSSAKDDQEYSTLSDRYKKSLDDKRAELSETIKDTRWREDFNNRNSVRIASGLEGVDSIARGKEKDFERGSIADNLNNLRDTGVAGNLIEAFDQASDILDASVEVGYYDNQEKTKILKQLQNDMAVGKLKMLAPDQRIDALKQDWAKNLPPDTHAELVRRAEADYQEKQAVDIVDSYDGMEREERLGKINDIKDKDLRKQVEERNDREMQRIDQAKNANIKDIYSRSDLLVEETGTTDSIPRDDWNAMIPSMRQNLKGQVANKTRPRTYSNPSTVDRLQELAAAKKWDLYAEAFGSLKSTLSASDREQYGKINAEHIIPVGVADKDYIKGLFPKSKDSEKRNIVSSQIDSWRASYTNAYGKEPTPAERDKEVNRLIMDYDKGWFSYEKPVYQHEAEERDEILRKLHIEELKEDYEPEFESVTNYFTLRGEQPDRYQFQEALEKQRMLEQVEDKGALQDVIGSFDYTPTHDEIFNRYLKLKRFRDGANR